MDRAARSGTTWCVKWATIHGLLTMAVLLGACGGAGRASVRTERAIVQASMEPAAIEPEPEVAITGLMGGIDPRSVELALSPRMDALAACVESRADAAVALGGRMRVAFRIGADGQVRWAVPVDSTVGDRDAERCALDVIRATRFRAPSGGDADAAWSFEAGDAAGLAWDERRARAAVARGRARISEACGEPCALRITAWVDARGRVVRAGASARERSAAERIDAVLEVVRGLRMPRAPRGRVARVTFDALR